MTYLKSFMLIAAAVIAFAGGGARVFAQDPPPPIEIVVTESIGVSDGSGTVPPEVVGVSESIGVLDTVSIVPPLAVLISESIGVLDTVSVVPPLAVLISESIGVLDTANAAPPLVISVTERIGVSDIGGPVDAAPIVEAGPDLTVDEGDAVNLAASVIVLDPQLTTATIDWGDGGTDQIVPTTAGAISATHLYSDDGTYTVTVTVSGLFGDQGVDNAQVEVLNLPPVVDAGGPYTLDTADPIGAVILTAIASDPGDDPITYAWDLDGDGQFDDGSNQSEMFNSTTAGVFFVSVEVQDDAGATTVRSSGVTVTDSTAGPGLPDDGATEPVDPSETQLLFVAQNGTVARPFQDGDQIRLDAVLQPGADYVAGTVDRIEFTLNGLPFPPDALVIAVPGPTIRYRVFMGANTASAGSLLIFVATAVDSSGTAIAEASLQIAIAPPLLVNILGPDEIAPGESALFQAEVLGGDQPVDITFIINNAVVSTGASFLSVTPEMIPGGPGESFVIAVQAVDNQGSGGTAARTVEITSPPGDETPEDPGDEAEAVDNIGRALGRAVIGRLVSLSGTMIVVTTKVGQDFTDVRVHVDRDATEFSEALDAEAYTTGSKVVVIADSDVLSGNATAIKITPIPSKTTRLHERVLVSKPTDGNAAKFVSGDGTVSDSVIEDEVGQFSGGDQVVVLTHRDDSNRRGEKPQVIINTNDVNDRLEQFAQKKFDDGDTDASGLIDRLAKDRRDDAQDRVDEAKEHSDQAVRDAAGQADEKIENAREKDAADPVTAIRKQAVAESEQAILDCASQIVGRAVSGEGDLTDEEKQRVVAACLGGDPDDGDAGRIPEEREDGERQDTPPPEILDCIIRVLGSVPNRPITDEERARVQAACVSDDVDEKSDPDEISDRDSESEVDARKIAFCESNPSDSHCSGDAKGSPGTKNDESGSEDEKLAYCSANPSDPRCLGDGGSKDGDDGKDSDGPSSEDEKLAYCSANPSDPRCSGDGGGSDDGGKSGSDGSKNDPGGDDGGKSGSDGSKDGSGTKPPGK